MAIVVRQTGGSAKNPRPDQAKGARKRSRRKHRRIEPYAWLTAGVVGLGMAAAATAGAGVAYADDTAGNAGSASASADSGSAKSASDGSKTASPGSKTDGDYRSTNDASGNKSADVAAADNLSDQASDDDSSKNGSKYADTSEEPKKSTDVEAGDEAGEVRSADKRSAGSHSRKAPPASPVDDGPAPGGISETDTRTATSVVRRPKPAEEVDQSASESPRTAAVSVFPPAAPSNAAADSATVDAADSRPAQASESVSVIDAQAKAAAPATKPSIGSLLKALFAGLQMTLFNQFAAAKPLQRPIQDPAIAEAVSETVPGTAIADGSNVMLAAADAVSAVLPPSKEDAGLSGPFLMPDASTGRTLNVKTYGATSNNSADNDALVINAVINAAQPGDVVYIPNGTYHIKSTINLKTGVSLVGQSRDYTVLAGASGDTPLSAMIFAAPGVNNLTVSNLKITLASGKAYKAGVRLGSTGGAPLSRIVVKNLFVEKFERFGVELHNTNNVLVDSNIIKNATALDGGGQGYGVLIDEALSSNNWVRNNTIGPVIRHAILIQRAHNNLIENNRITGTVSGAIDLHGEDEYSNEIRYNTISDGVRNGTTVSPNGAGIEVGEYSGVIGTDQMHDNSGPGNYIHHNTVYNYSYGLRIMNNSNYTYIEDNVFRNNSGPGILADLAPLNHLYLSRNQVNNNAHGIILYDVTQAVVTDNIVRYNSGYGIAINPGTTDYVITGNTVTNNGTNVYLTNSNGTYIPKSSSTALPLLWWI